MTAPMARRPIRVQFIHGLESNPQSRKARVLDDSFVALTPAMDTRDFEACVQLQSEVAAMWGPVVLIGSSFGGAVATAMLQRRLWQGTTLLLASASVRKGLPESLPGGVRVRLVHATADDIVPVDDARRILTASPQALVDLVEVDDDHALTHHVRDGALARWVHTLADEALA